MKTNRFKFLTIVLTVFTAFAATGAVRAQLCEDPVPPPNVGEVEATLNGINGTMFSPSGKWTVLQLSTGFYVLPTERLEEAANDLDNPRYRFTEGYAKGFLPQSEKVVFAPRRGLYVLDPLTSKTAPIFQANGEDSGEFLEHSRIIVASEDLVISGDGDYTKSSDNGNILRFDVPRRTMTRAEQINGFRRAFLSPTRKYVLYGYPSEAPIDIDLYDIARDVNTPIGKNFGFKQRYPKYVIASVFPLGWIAAEQFVLVVNESPTEEYEEQSKDEIKAISWLVSFDVGSGKIIWKQQLKGFDRAAHFEKLSETKAFFDTGDGGRFEVSLADGKLIKLPRLEGTGFSFSPNKKLVAFSDGRRIFVSSPNGASKKLAYEIPENREGEIVLSADKNRIIWSPDGERLLVSNGVRTIIIKLKNQNSPANASGKTPSTAG